MITLSKRIVLISLIIFSLFFFVPIPAEAHANFVSSNPSPNSILTKIPNNITIQLSESVQEGTDYVYVTLSNGIHLDTGQAAIISPTDPCECIITMKLKTNIPVNFTYDVYTVVWSTNSKTDGHYTTGKFTFAVQFPNGTLPGNANDFSSVATSPTYINIDLPVKFVALSIMMFILMDNYLVLPTNTKVFKNNEMEDEKKRNKYYTKFLSLSYQASKYYFIAMILWFLAEAYALESQHFVHVGYAAFLLIFNVDTLISPFYLGILIRIAISFVMLILSRQFLKKASEQRLFSNYHKSMILLILISIFIETLTTHASTSALWFFTIPIEFVHLMAVSFWAGGTFFVAGMFYVYRNDFDEQFHMNFARIFGSLVKYSIDVMAVSGALIALLLVGSLDGFFSSFYGQIIILKILLFGGILLFGRYNRNILRKIGGQKLSFKFFAKNMYWEAFFALFIIFVASFLSYIPPPTQQAPDLSSQSFDSVVSDAHIYLRINPRPQSAGVFNFTVSVFHTQDGSPDNSVTNISIRFTLVDSATNLPPERLYLGQGTANEYFTQSPILSQSGHWQMEVSVSRANQLDITAIFNVIIF